MLGTRVLTALVALVGVLAALYLLPSMLVLLLIGIVVVIGAMEWGRFVTPGNPSAGILFAGCLIPLLLGAEVLIIRAPSVTHYLLLATQILWLVSIVFVVRFPVRFSQAVTAVFGLILLLATFVALAQLYLLGNGPELLLAMLVIVWAADVGAYFSGRQFGRHKLAPTVSPGKTWEGVAGGLLLVAIVSLLGAPLLHLGRLDALSIALPVAMISVVGDLTVSMFKRNAGLKDSGTLFPGHGGVMDRIDSVSAAAPLFVILWQLVRF